MIHTELQQLIKPLVENLGYELWGCEYLSRGGHSLLRIYIDKLGGISLADCEAVSKEVSALLDVEDILQGEYSLEISSPGIPRPLFTNDHYERYIGSMVLIKLHRAIEGKRKIKAKIVSVDDHSVVLDNDGAELKVELSQIMKANLISE